MNPLLTIKLMSTKQCTYQGCKVRFPEGIIHIKGKYGKNLSWWPDGKYLFHYQDTHGFPHEMMIEELSKMVNREVTEDEIGEYNKVMQPVKERVLR